VKRALILAAALLGAASATGEARAAGECRGLDVCVSVPGPWVAVPSASFRQASVVHYQLTCPRRHIVGGLDALLSDRRIDLKFLGTLGSPVNPGVTTGRSAVFVATYARLRRSAFRPFLGCIPQSGGGGRETTSFEPAAAPQQARPRPRPALERRVWTVRVRPGATRTFTARCRPAERLVGSSHAVGFRRKAAPGADVMGGVSVQRSEQGSAVRVSASRNSAVPRGSRVEVQVHLLCARGPA
jgi:hypothetical protein